MTDRNTETEIRAVLDRWAEGIRAKDIDAIVACYADDILCYDCHSHFELRGADENRAHLEACFPHMEGGMVFEMYELCITGSGDAAFCTCLARCGSKGLDGQEHGGWLRVTVGFRRGKGGWKMVHGHNSAPFNPETGATMFGEVPQRMATTAVA